MQTYNPLEALWPSITSNLQLPLNGTPITTDGLPSQVGSYGGSLNCDQSNLGAVTAFTSPPGTDSEPPAEPWMQDLLDLIDANVAKKRRIAALDESAFTLSNWQVPATAVEQTQGVPSNLLERARRPPLAKKDHAAWESLRANYNTIGLIGGTCVNSKDTNAVVLKPSGPSRMGVQSGTSEDTPQAKKAELKTSKEINFQNLAWLHATLGVVLYAIGSKTEAEADTIVRNIFSLH
ncbi:hypothetical protein HDU81_004397, partial [Chytriomyces hyalinus]